MLCDMSFANIDTKSLDTKSLGEVAWLYKKTSTGCPLRAFLDFKCAYEFDSHDGSALAGKYALPA